MVLLLIVVALVAWWFVGVGETEGPGPASVSEPAGTTSSPQVTVYDGVSVSASIKSLDLSGRGLTGSLKAEVRQLSDLEALNISDNDFTGLPAEVGQLSELRILNLSNNPFTGLPHELGNLQQLETLDLRGTQYSTIDLQIIKSQLPAGTVVLTDEN